MIINKDNYFGQVAIKKNGYWIGRKLIKKNFHPYSKCVRIADDLARKQFAEVHVSIFFAKDPFDPNSDLIGDFLIDIDGDDLKQSREDARFVCAWLADMKVPFRIAFTSHRGFKIYVPFEAFGVNPTPVLPQIYKQFAELISFATGVQSIDMQVYQARHMNRWDNTIHEKTGNFQVPITFDELMREMDIAFLISFSMEQRFNVESVEFPVPSPLLREKIATIEKALKQKEEEMRAKQKESKTAVKKDLNIQKKLRPCILNILSTGSVQGERNTTAFILASDLRRTGFSREEVMEKLLGWNTLNNPPLPERELTYVLKSAFKNPKPYSYGCNNAVLAKNCPFPDRKICTFYREFIGIKNDNPETIFEEKKHSVNIVSSHIGRKGGEKGKIKL